MDNTLQEGATLRGSVHSYLLQRELGRGEGSATFLAQREDGRPVALKALLIGQLGKWDEHAELENEIELLRAIDHPQIPDYLDHMKLGDDPDAPTGLALVQEHIDGVGLDRVLAGERRLDPGQMMSWLTQLLEAVAYLHHLSPPVVHGGISPKKILLRDDGTAYLVGFGSASDEALGYTAPEQHVDAAGPGSDLFSLAMTFLAVTAGKEPAELPLVGAQVDVAAAARLDARVAQLLRRLLEPDPGRRLDDARVALEQLRPLRGRYAEREGVEAPAMQRAAAQIEAEHIPAGRPPVASDELLPSERIREAHARLERIGAPLEIPDVNQRAVELEGGVIAASGGVVCIDHHVLDVATMARSDKLRRNAKVIACSATASTLVAKPEDSERLVVFTRAGDRYEEGPALKGGDTWETVVSPDGGSLVKNTSDALELYDLRSGSLSQRIEGSFEGIGYSADGRVLYGRDGGGYRLRLLNADGSEQVVKDCRGVAFASDGDTAALFIGERLLIGPIAQLIAGEAPRSLRVGDSGWRSPCFSPDGQWLAVQDYSEDRILLIEARTGRLLHTLRDPGQPDTGGIRSCRGLGFSTDSRRLLALCETHFNRFAGSDRYCLALWALPSGSYLGALLRSSGSRRNLIYVSAAGYYGRADDKRGGMREAGKSPWEKPELAVRALCGEPVERSLDEAQRAQLADLEDRWAFFSDLRSHDRLDEKANLGALVEASAGSAHLLDLAIKEARQAQADAPAFGAGAKVREITGDQLLAAIKELGTRPAEQREKLYQELLAEAEQAEVARARILARAPQPAAKKVDAPPPRAKVEARSTASPESEAFWGDADRRTVRVFAMHGAGVIAIILGIVASLAGTAAWLISGASFWRTLGPTALASALFLLILLAISLVSIQVDRRRRTARVFRTPLPIIAWDSALEEMKIRGDTNELPGMGSIGRDFRIYLSGSGGLGLRLFKAGKRSARAARMVEKIELLLHPPS